MAEEKQAQKLVLVSGDLLEDFVNLAREMRFLCYNRDDLNRWPKVEIDEFQHAIRSASEHLHAVGQNVLDAVYECERGPEA